MEMILEKKVLDMQSENKDLLVAVYMITYNHEDFIAQAVESIMMQKTNFKYKLFIGEDCSTDKTREICIVLEEKYTDKIELVLQSKNIGPKKNAEKVFKECFESGAKYIAICEGDDYWIDPYKLQKQVDFLEKNKSYSMVCTNVENIDNLGFFKRKRFKFKNSFDIDAKYLIKNNHITTCTVMANSSILQLRTHVTINFADKHMWLTLLENGKCFYLNEITARYRMHDKGFYSGLKESSKSIKRIEDYKIYRKEFPSIYKTITFQLYKYLLRGIISSLKNRNYKALKHLLKLVFFK